MAMSIRVIGEEKFHKPDHKQETGQEWPEPPQELRQRKLEA
jgi:hypothetical protein